MAYKALRPLQVGDVQKQPGDLIEEAMEWGNLRAWLEHGFIEEVPDAPAPKPAAKKTAAKKSTAKKTTARKKES